MTVTSTTGDRYLVISADCHGGAAIDEYRGYLEQRYLDEFDAWVRDFAIRGATCAVLTAAATGTTTGASPSSKLTASSPRSSSPTRSRPSIPRRRS